MNNNFQNVIDCLYAWSTENKLNINLTKTKVVQFEKRTAHRDTEELYRIRGDDISNTETIKFLGITFDRKLNFSIQANNIENRTLKLVNATARLAKYVNNRKLNAILY